MIWIESRTAALTTAPERSQDQMKGGLGGGWEERAGITLGKIRTIRHVFLQDDGRVRRLETIKL